MFDNVVTALGVLVLALGLVSGRLVWTPLPATVLALLAGVLVGPAVLGWVDVSVFGDRSLLVERVARLTLGIGLLGVALRIPKSYPRRHWRELLVVIGLGMPLMWIFSAATVYFILGQPFWMAALIGAIVTATDPIAATPMVTGPVAERYLPERLRMLISFESGANDGLAYLFVFLPFLLLTRPAGEAVWRWLYHTLLWQVIVAALIGWAIGHLSARLLRAAERRDLILEKWRLVFTVAMSLAALGIGRVMRSDEVLIVFAAGVAFTQLISGEDRKNEEHGQEAVNRFFSIPIFTLLGATIPWDGWRDLGWSGLILAFALLLLRRPPALLLMRPLLPSVRGWRQALFVGWFGPIAVAATYYASLMERRLNEPVIWHAVSLIVVASVVLHGATFAPFTMLFGRTTTGAAASDETLP